ncbi:response regulator [Variovorax sp. J22R133]|uniref:response regulator transcription factor n=1 Tax=Variovorax brevis TaxID=3053503 RepID=UPI002578724E|nr:response regulator [Variovorax sp. J22R133]MDM0117309.1 response regulator [Variovorax sp. J22R133]
MTTKEPLIAVVDDESALRVMLGRVLRLAHYQVAAFESGEEFLDSLNSRIPACAILDIHMPGLSGFEVQSRLHAVHLRIPVIFITASDDGALDHLGRDPGAARLLHKPFSSDTLLQAVSDALAQGSAQDRYEALGHQDVKVERP